LRVQFNAGRDPKLNRARPPGKKKGAPDQSAKQNLAGLRRAPYA
jgi:hypothetical protein